MSKPYDPSAFTPCCVTEVLAIPAGRIAAIEALASDTEQFIILDFLTPVGSFRLRFDRTQMDRLLEHLPETLREIDRFQKGYNPNLQAN